MQFPDVQETVPRVCVFLFFSYTRTVQNLCVALLDPIFSLSTRQQETATAEVCIAEVGDTLCQSYFVAAISQAPFILGSTCQHGAVLSVLHDAHHHLLAKRNSAALPLVSTLQLSPAVIDRAMCIARTAANGDHQPSLVSELPAQKSDYALTKHVMKG